MLPPRAYTFIGLNAVRILSIISLLLVFASNIVTLVNDIKAVNRFMEAGKDGIAGANNATLDALRDFDYISDSTVPNQPAGAFWAVLNRLFIIGQVVVLVGSELSFPSQFFVKFFPVLGKEFGLGPLGLIQMLIGAAILSHRVDTFTLVSAFFLFSVGCLNVLLGLIFRASAKSKRSVTSWREHAKNALPTHIGPVDVRPVVNAGTQFMSQKSTPFNSPPPFVSHLHTGSSTASGSTEKSGLGFGRQAEKAAGLRGYLLSKPVESLPKYSPPRPSY
ncbi:hypothetical protein CC1G_09110 [Coprinopsis cinerea okayama7|uniref:DUF7598 domain-containing protein n=1 Tax=Coprinopsis cinerea (strain Okayama-7 / 130 / ATCC MYA-4618 / FGSC 9003) TaxID=240176 RepID=A8NJ60_COPC7|nr:hypothetical protein CC1G_09110 [Coprinopsis cinerea okayama7\|eukprot:XP_001834153.2 hypothetical protein CC1G_09110 [Coprinopsis cinerea okayama7\